MNYSDIERVNADIKGIDLKGKNYAMVPERVTAFRKLYPEGFITTQIISNDGTTVLMQATVGYYREDGEPFTLATGFAQEVRGRGMVNGTSHIENCETSAVGRALGMIGIGVNGGGICSAEELTNAVVAQRQMKEEEEAFANPPQKDVGGVSKSKKIPEPSVEAFLKKSMVEMREMRGISAAENNKLFAGQKAALVEAGLAPDKSLADYTMKEAEALIDAMYHNFSETGLELKK
jgi:hypothetical protein